MGFLSRLFGGGEAQEVIPELYQGYQIFPEAKAEGGHFRVSGRICLPSEGGEPLVHRFERSDLLGSAGEANALMLQKAQRMIDEQGQGIFRR
jgi:hypothetical protein